ncbi:NAD(P)H-hydrate dehydratase [Methylocystis sp. WRRC1]|uniref:NAD(P)H-hydrate dehydratase n=1 Tax=Methylocystis sp. WRRC1 TaxID=1732014 RepID=UPI001D153B8A|nr:NAD(P)H-hydrate dehydratase [Methylocystis sp. WRRC1]MCC3244572.1 NAD(P)H-hydrate dehydratase [Methylocystis sp. WRRC1]
MPYGPFPLELLTTEQMARADRLTIESGVPGMALMEKAAAALARVTSQILQRTSGRRVLVLCGPGNNGGDGYVAARLLRGQRYKVRVASLVPPNQLRGDAARAAAGWVGEVIPAQDCDFTGVDLVIDALFGTGLARDLDPEAQALVKRLNQWRRETKQNVVSVDIPSGVDGTTGAIRGAAVEADATVTFFRVKTGHLLLPGRSRCGALTCAHIGIRSSALATIDVKTFVNMPALWQQELPLPQIEGHKYSRGHALVVSGGASFTGAARLSAAAALRAGAGLVTLASPTEALAVNASALTSVMVRPADGAKGLAAVLSDERKNAVAIGPGLGVSEESCRQVETALTPQAYRRAAVLDADALTSFADDPFRLWRATRAAPGPVVMTPHAGEFGRLFSECDSDRALRSKLDKARDAARVSGAVVLYKGPDTVVAAPDGRVSILPWATPWLATAGSGDVLTGIIAGLLAQRMDAFAAASCAAWMHARAAEIFGPGLIADDITATLPMVWRELQGKQLRYCPRSSSESCVA